MALRLPKFALFYGMLYWDISSQWHSMFVTLGVVACAIATKIKTYRVWRRSKNVIKYILYAACRGKSGAKVCETKVSFV